MFAIVASIMRRNGAYVRCIPPDSDTGEGSSAGLLGKTWPADARKVGQLWLDSINKTVTHCVGSGNGSIRKALEQVEVPPEVQLAWDVLLELADTADIEGSCANDRLCTALIQLCGYADEAACGIGLPSIHKGKDHAFLSAASLLLGLNDNLSYCHRIDTRKARVLTKKHTPQQGLTLRSMTHHMSLCMPWEVEARWHEIKADAHDDILNLLLLPWPLEVETKNFHCKRGGTHESLPCDDRLFEYSRASIKPNEFESRIHSAIKQSKKWVSRLDALVLPELALTRNEWDVVERIAINEKLLLVSGIMDDVDPVSGLPVNSCRINLDSTIASGPGSLRTEYRKVYRQAKHHRWCLDRSQVLQYELGGQLPSTKRCRKIRM